MLVHSTLVPVPVATVRHRPRNANVMEPEKYEALKADVQRCADKQKENVLLGQPPLVRVLPNSEYEIVDGHHRFRAAGEIGITSLASIVAEMPDEEAAAEALGMNQRRGALDLAEAGEIIAELIKGGADVLDLVVQTGFTVEEIEALTATPEHDVEKAIAEAAASAQGAAEEKLPRPFVLELEFATRAEYGTARKFLKRAAGPSENLGVGLLNIIEGTAAPKKARKTKTEAEA